MFPAKLDEDQQHLIDTLWQGFQRAGDWPKYFYLEAMLDKRDLDAEQVLAGLPVIGGGSPRTAAYGLVRPSYVGPTRPQAGTPVPLTLAGLSYVPEAAGAVDSFFALLDVMARLRREAVFDPLKETMVQVTSTHLATELGMDEDDLRLLGVITLTEPATSSQGAAVDGDEWARQIGRGIRHFAGVRSIPEYLERIAAYYTVPEPAPAPRYPSPFELGASLDYLNAVWKLRFGKQRPVLRIFSAERCGKLGLEAATSEEFYARLTALAEIIKDLDVPGTPGVGGHPLERVRGFLAAQLSQPNTERISTAIDSLDAIRSLRDSGQHTDAMVKAIERLASLGLAFPITDWSGAWSAISTAAIDAVDALRDEISTDDARRSGSEPA